VLAGCDGVAGTSSLPVASELVVVGRSGPGTTCPEAQSLLSTVALRSKLKFSKTTSPSGSTPLANAVIKQRLTG
jgi:hypothetical protein